MDRIAQIFDHKFPSGFDLPIAVISTSLDEIASRFELKPESWDEAGLGPARGVFIGLPSGKVVLILELEHAIKRLGACGPQVLADGADVAVIGVGALLDEMVHALDLPDDAVAW